MKRPTDAENRQIGTKAIIDIYGQIFTLKTIFKKDKVSYSLFLILFTAAHRNKTACLQLLHLSLNHSHPPAPLL